MSVWKRKAYFWVTMGLFLLSLGAHWAFSWHAFKQDAAEHHTVAQFNDYFVQTMRDTMENWQSEFLQLIWQIVGLSFLWYTGSPSSKEGDDRKEAKLDYLLRKIDPEKAEAIIRSLEEKYPKD